MGKLSPATGAGYRLGNQRYMGMETFSVRLSDATILQIRGHRYSIDPDA